MNSVAWTTKLKNSKSIVVAVMASAFVLGTVGCSKNEPSNEFSADSYQAQSPAQNQNSPSANGRAPSSIAPSSGSPAPTASAAVPSAFANDPSVRVTQSQNGQQIIQSAPVVAPPSYFSPSAVNVQSALGQVLVNTVAGMADSPERTRFYQTQALALQNLKVSQCTQAVAGQPVMCNINMAGRDLQVRLLLTQGGWVIVK